MRRELRRWCVAASLHLHSRRSSRRQRWRLAEVLLLLRAQSTCQQLRLRHGLRLLLGARLREADLTISATVPAAEQVNALPMAQLADTGRWRMHRFGVRGARVGHR